MNIEETIGMFMDCVIDIHILKKTLDDARVSQLDDDSDELKQIIDNIWSELTGLIVKRNELRDYIFSHSCYAPEDIDEIEQNALDLYYEQTAKV